MSPYGPSPEEIAARDAINRIWRAVSNHINAASKRPDYHAGRIVLDYQMWGEICRLPPDNENPINPEAETIFGVKVSKRDWAWDRIELVITI